MACRLNNQMYAYQKKYKAESITLLYPLTDEVRFYKNIQYSANDGTVIKVRFVDLFDIETSMSEIISEFEDAGKQMEVI